MAVLLRFPHRATADPNLEPQDGADRPSASIVILPCIRREAMLATTIPGRDPVLLKA